MAYLAPGVQCEGAPHRLSSPSLSKSFEFHSAFIISPERLNVIDEMTLNTSETRLLTVALALMGSLLPGIKNLPYGEREIIWPIISGTYEY